MAGAAAKNTKATGQYFRIGQISSILDLKPSVLRYWEQEFPFLVPVRLPSGHRVYSQENLQILQRIKDLLYNKGMTIDGARQLLRRQLKLSMTEEELEARTQYLNERREHIFTTRHARIRRTRFAGTRFMRSLVQELKAIRQELASEEAAEPAAGPQTGPAAEPAPAAESETGPAAEPVPAAEPAPEAGPEADPNLTSSTIQGGRE